MKESRLSTDWPFQVPWVILIASCLYVALSVLVDDPISIRLLNSMIVTMSLACMWLYAPLAWEALSRRRPSNAAIMGLGLFIASLGSCLQRAASMMVRDFGLLWITDNLIIPVGLFFILVSRVFQVLAIGNMETGDARNKWGTIWVATLGGVSLAILVTISQYAVRYLPGFGFL